MHGFYEKQVLTLFLPYVIVDNQEFQKLELFICMEQIAMQQCLYMCIIIINDQKTITSAISLSSSDIVKNTTPRYISRHGGAYSSQEVILPMWCFSWDSIDKIYKLGQTPSVG